MNAHRSVPLFLILATTWVCAQSLSLVLTSPPTSEVKPGQVVTHIFRIISQSAEASTPRLTVCAGWPLLSPRPVGLVLSPGKPHYVFVILRVPEGAPAESRCTVSLNVQGQSVSATATVTFVAGASLKLPRNPSFKPPYSPLPLQVTNTGNGMDTFTLLLTSLSGTVLSQVETTLAAHTTGSLSLPLASAGVFKLVLESRRAPALRLSRIIQVKPFLAALGRAPGAPLQLLGTLGISWGPGSMPSLSLAASGPLSDFVQSNFGLAYAPGAAPSGQLQLYGRGFSLGLGYHNTLSLTAQGRLGGVDLSLQHRLDGTRSRLGANWLEGGFANTFTLVILPQPRLSLESFTQNQVGFMDYSSSWLPQSGRLTAEIHYRRSESSLPFGFGVGFAAGAGEPLATSLEVQGASPRYNLGFFSKAQDGNIISWRLAATSSLTRLFKDPSLPAVDLAISTNGSKTRFLADTTLILPYPLQAASLALETGYTSGTWYSTLNTSFGLRKQQASYGFDLNLGMGTPKLIASGQLEWGNAVLGAGAKLSWDALAGTLVLGADASLPVDSALISLRAEQTLGSASSTSFNLSGTLPLGIKVSDIITQTFGGRNVGAITGQVQGKAVPAGFLSGLVVRAGPYQARTTASGRFRIELPPGHYTLRIDLASLPAGLTLLHGEQAVTVRYHRTTTATLSVSVRSTLSGLVRVLRSGKPIPPGKLRFVLSLAKTGGQEVRTQTDAKGAFSFSGLPPGRYSVVLLQNLLPSGWTLEGAAGQSLQLFPGEAGRVSFTVQAPKAEVFKPGTAQVRQVKVETSPVPPGSSPLVNARLIGRVDRVFVESGRKVLGRLLPVPGGWQGRISIPANSGPTLILNLVAMSHGVEVTHYPFFLAISNAAPWGQVRTPPVVKPNSRVPLLVHWYAPVRAAWVEVGGKRVPLVGKGADWRSELRVPAGAGGRFVWRVVAKLANGHEVRLSQAVLVR